MTKRMLNKWFSAILVLSWVLGLMAPSPTAAAPVAPGTEDQAQAQNGWGPVIQTVTPVDTTGMGPIPASDPFAPQKGELPVRETGFLLPKGATGALSSASDPVLQDKGSALNMPDPLVNFEGGNNTEGVYPPDTDGEVGPNHYVQMVNLHTTIYDKTGTILYGPFTPNLLWPTGNPCRTTNDGDPVVLYDQLADRWLLSQFGLPNFPSGPYYECVAISKTPVPTNNPNDWWIYTITASTTKMNDYPKLAVWPDAYYVTANQFTNGSSWGGAGVWAYERDKMLLGQSAQIVYFDLFTANSSFGGMLPVDLDGSTLPPAGSPGYFFEVDDSTWIPSVDAMRVWEFHVDWATPANSTFGISGQPNAVLPVANFNPLPCTVSGSRSCIPQPGTSVKLDAIGDRLMFRAAYRNLGSHEAVVLNHTVLADGTDRAGVRWYEVRDPGGTPSVYQQGTFAPSDGNHRWMASVAMDHVGNIGLGYSVSSSTMFPSIRYTGRLASDPLGDMPQGEAIVINGTGAQTGTGSRWGDYSAMSVDPVDDCTFWYTQEYIQTTGTAPWRTRVASFKFPTCAIGPMGTLTGTVTDAVTNNPIQGATVQATATVTMTGNTVTDAAGHYSLSLVAGTYDVVTSAYGYLPSTVNGVVVNQNAITVQDFDLDPAEIFTVSGNVYDVTTGWPLYAMVQIDGYPGAPIWTDPATGAYSIDLPAGLAYTFNVSAFSAGYHNASVPVGPLTGDLVQDFPLDVDLVACIAPGYQGINGIYETFSSTAPPAGWTVTNNGGTCNWAFNDPGARGNLTGGSGNFAVADADACGSGTTMNTTLLSPVVDVSALATLNLSFNYDYRNLVSTEVAAVDLSANGGSTWTNLFTWNTSHRGPATYSQDVTTIAGGSTQARLRFRYVAPGWDWWWEVDNVSLGQRTCIPLAGGLAVGTVTDANTTLGLDGATVTNEAGYSALSVPTPADASLADGFYTVFSPAGTQVFTATLAGYGADVASVIVPLSDTVRQDFVLDTGLLTYAPPSMDVTLQAGSSLTQTLLLTNTGGTSAAFELIELDRGVVPFGPFDPQPEVVVRSFRQQYPSITGTNASPNPTDWLPLAAGDVVESWQATVPAWGVSYNPVDHTVWVSSPSTAWGGSDKLVEYELDGSPTGREIPHATTDIPHTNGPADLAFNWNTGTMWVMNVDPPATCIYEIDPLTGYTGAKICPQNSTGFTVSQRGLAYDPAGDTYFAGGWNDDTVYRFRPDGTLLGSKNVGLNVAGLAFNPDTNHLFVLVSGTPGNVYVLNVANNYAQVGTFHIPGMSATGGAGLEMACDGRLWAVDQNTETVYMAESGETTSLCAGYDVSWLTENPISGTVGAGATVPIEIGFDATTAQPGIYDAQIKFMEDTPYQLSNLPVQLTVTVPPNWGKIAGSVETTGYCDVEQHFLADVPVLIETSIGVTYTLQTDANGAYGLWMPTAQSPLTITVNTPGYSLGQATGVVLNNVSTTTQDFTLRWLEPCVTASPASMTVNLALGQNSNRSLRINNLGGASTTYTLTEEYVSSPALPIYTPPAVETSPDIEVVTIGDLVLGPNAGAQPGATVVPAAPTRPDATVTLTHSASQAITALNSVSCNASGLHADNHYLRVFNLPSFGINTTLAVTNVEMGIETASGPTGTQPVEVRLYTLQGALTWANLTPIGSANFSVTNQSATIINVPVTGLAPAGSTLVVDFFTPSGQAAGNSLFVGSNNLGQTAPSYLSAASCGITEPTDTATVGFPGMHIVMNVTGNTGGGIAADVPWLSENPLTGTIAPDAHVFSTVTFDANVVSAPGAYLGNVVVHSDDPVNPTSVVQTTMNVSAPANWGVLSGTVRSLGYCDITPGAAFGALVQATGTNAITRQVTAVAGGSYTLWLDSNFSPYTVVVSFPDHLPLTFTGVTVNGLGAVTDLDADLRKTDPCLDVNPVSFNVTVPWGGTLTQTLTLENLGAASTPFTITESAGGFNPVGPQPNRAGGPDAFGYTYRDSAEPGGPVYNWIDATDGTQVTFSGDDGEVTITSPFPLKYYGNSAVTNLRLGKNGALLMNATTGEVSFSNVSMATAPNNLVAFMWDDMGAGGSVYWKVIGIPPARQLVIEFVNVPRFSAIGAATYEVIFNENGSIRMQYQDVMYENTTYNNGASATVGIRGSSAANSLQYSHNQAFLSNGLAICFAYPGAPTDCSQSTLNLPWLTETPTQGTLTATPPGTPQAVTLDFDSTDPSITQPGIYNGTLNVISLDPVHPVVQVPVAMNVLPSATQGKLDGTIYNLGYCDTNPVPLPGAAVHIQPASGSAVDLVSDASGNYSYWFDVASNPITVTASAAGWVTNSAVGSVTSGITTTLDVSLRWNRPCGSVDTNAIDVTLSMGVSTTVPMTIDNTGAAALNFVLEEGDPSFTPTAPQAVDVLIISESATSANAMAAALTNLGYTSQITTTAGLAGNLLQYAAVFYAGVPSSGTEQNSLVAYLNAGGRLLVSDNDFGFSSGTSTLYTVYFQAAYSGVDAGSDGPIHGVERMSGIDTDISSDPFPDSFTITGANGVGLFANTAPRTNWAGMRITRNAYKAVYLAWDYQHAGGSATGDPVETAIMKRIMQYLDPVDVPWLSEAPTTAVVPPDTGTQPVNVTLDAGDASVTQPGTYHATLTLLSNDPTHPLLPIPVTMTVSAPASWGKLEGIVESQGYCDINPSPIAGASVEVVTSGGYTYTLTTDTSGHYQVWMDAPTNSPVTVTVTAPVHVPGTVAGVALTPGATTTQDFDLRWLVSCTSSAPASLDVTVEPGGTASANLTLSNDGAGATSFNVAEMDGGFVPGAGGSPNTSTLPSAASGGNASEVFSSAKEADGPAAPTGYQYVPHSVTRVIFDNGPIVNSPGTGAGGADESQLQLALGMTIYGFGHAQSSGFRVADDFTLTAPVDIDEITFFAYQTGSTTTSTMTGVNLRIWDGDPSNPASTVIFGDTTTNRMVATSWSHIYRVDTGTSGATNRPVMANTVDIGITLPPGTYWLDWQTAGSLASGPWVPAVTINGKTTTGNAIQYDGTAWAALTDVGPQGLPFVINGEFSDVPWISVSPISGTISADGSQQIQVDFNPTITQTNGTYTAYLLVDNDDPVSGSQPSGQLVIPVTMHVTGSGYSVTATGNPLTQFGDPGEVVTYTLTVQNTGNAADTYDIAASGVWPASTSVTTVSLGIGASADVIVSVTVPSGNGGDSDVTTVTVTSQADSTVTTQVDFTTIIGVWKLYLPLAAR